MTVDPVGIWYRSYGGHEVFRTTLWTENDGTQLNALIMQGGAILDHARYDATGLVREDVVDPDYTLIALLPEHSAPPPGWETLPSWGEPIYQPKGVDAAAHLRAAKLDAQRCLAPGARYEIRERINPDRGKSLSWYRHVSFDLEPTWKDAELGPKPADYSLIGQFYAGER